MPLPPPRASVGRVPRWVRSFARALDGESAATERQLRSFERLFLIALVGEYWSRILLVGVELPVPLWLAGVAALSFALGTERPTLRQTCFGGLAALHIAISAYDFPATANHSFLVIALCLLASVLAPGEPAERTLYARAVRWVVVVVLFFSGAQKLAHGYWIDGAYLAHALSRETYASALGALIPAEELARLQSLDGSLGSGPYRPDTMALVLLSNATWVAEMLLAVLLVLPRTRLVALVATCFLFLAIEVAAREIFFGLIFLSGLSVFGPPALSRNLLLPYAIVVALLLLVRLGVLPEVVFR